MERLRPLPAAFLKAEDADAAASLAIGSLTVFRATRAQLRGVRASHRGTAAPSSALPTEAAHRAT